eukprot:gene17730-12701_t
MSGNKKNQPKKNKVDKKQFEEVLSQLNSESKAIEQAAVQKGTFATYSFWVSVAPLYLYVVGVYETNVVSNILYFAAGTIISALTLYHLYGLVAIGKKNSLMEHGGAFSLALGESDSKRKTILKTVAHQSCYFSLFLVNFIHLIVYLLSVGYILPTYQLSHPINYLVAAILTSIFSYVVLSVAAKVL